MLMGFHQFIVVWKSETGCKLVTNLLKTEWNISTFFSVRVCKNSRIVELTSAFSFRWWMTSDNWQSIALSQFRLLNVINIKETRSSASSQWSKSPPRNTVLYKKNNSGRSSSNRWRSSIYSGSLQRGPNNCSTCSRTIDHPPNATVVSVTILCGFGLFGST